MSIKQSAATPTQIWESALAVFMAHHGAPGRGVAAAGVIAGEIDPLRKKIANQAERIRYLEGATNHATGTPLSQAQAKIDQLEAEVKRLRGADDTGDDSLYNVRRLRAELAELKANGAADAFVSMSIRASEAESRVAQLEQELANIRTATHGASK